MKWMVWRLKFDALGMMIDGSWDCGIEIQEVGPFVTAEEPTSSKSISEVICDLN